MLYILESQQLLGCNLAKKNFKLYERQKTRQSVVYTLAKRQHQFDEFFQILILHIFDIVTKPFYLKLFGTPCS